MSPKALPPESCPTGPSRRSFLSSASLAVASLPFASHRLAALPLAALPRSARSLAPLEIVPQLQSTSADVLRAFALAAMDAARAAGASYADIRVSDTPSVSVRIEADDQAPGFGAGGGFYFGVRVVVNGASAFSSGDRPDLDVIITAVKNAVATARGLSRAIALPTELVPAPVVTGEWETPMAVDPFTVPVQAQWDILGGYVSMVNRVRYASMPKGGFSWIHETRVFASTEGSLITQRFRRAEFDLRIGGSALDQVVLSLGGSLRDMGGFELATDPAFHPYLVRRAEEAVRLSTYPPKQVDVGRYNVVMTGGTVGTFMGRTVSPALELDRALGHEAGASGTSYLAPPLDVLGTQVFSPHVTVTSAHDAPTAAHRRWDDEGVECAPVTLVEQGRLVDFMSSRTTAGALRAWYERNGRSVRSNGHTTTTAPIWAPMPYPGHVTLHAASNGPTLEALCREIKRGIVVYGAGFNTDQQLSSVFAPIFAFEVTNGRMTHQIKNAGLQMATKQMWVRSLKALGGASTVEHSNVYLFKSQPATYGSTTATAPAGMFTDINIIRV